MQLFTADMINFVRPCRPNKRTVSAYTFNLYIKSALVAHLQIYSDEHLRVSGLGFSPFVRRGEKKILKIVPVPLNLKAI